MTFDYQDLKINYNIFDEREDKVSNQKPLLLLHGWMANIEAWTPIYNYFKKTRPVYVIDFPGQGGKSSTLTEVWGIPEYAKMVKTFIEKMQIENCDVIGHSFGGRIIIYLASQYDSIFNKIVLTDSAGIKPKSSIQKTFKILSYKLMKNLAKLLLSKEKYEIKIKELRTKNGSSDYASLTSDVMRETFKNIVNSDLRASLKNISNPTLLMWGENDSDTPLYMAKIMEKEIKDSGLVILKNAGHFSYLDNTAEYMVVVNEFLK